MAVTYTVNGFKNKKVIDRASVTQLKGESFSGYKVEITPRLSLEAELAFAGLHCTVSNNSSRSTIYISDDVASELDRGTDYDRSLVDLITSPPNEMHAEDEVARLGLDLARTVVNISMNNK